MIFWRTYNNQVYNCGECSRLGFPITDPSYIPDEYLERKEFIIMRTCFGIGDWGIISAMPKKLKEKYPDCKVYIPSPSLLRNMFGSLEANWSSWDDPFQVVHAIFDNNPYVDGFVDSFDGDVFNDHYRVYDTQNNNEPLIIQMLRFWQITNFDNIEPTIYFSEKEKALGDYIIETYAKGEKYGTVLLSNRSTPYDYLRIRDYMEKHYPKLPVFCWFKQPYVFASNSNILDLRHIDIRVQMYLKTKAVINIGNQCGVNDTIANYAPTVSIQRGELGSNFLPWQTYI